MWAAGSLQRAHTLGLPARSAPIYHCAVALTAMHPHASVA
eukprot:COSAG06_NODE_34008_length_481_cov_0.680628_1_plen_39_part_10